MLHFNHNIYVPKCQIVRFTEPFSFKKLSGFTPFFVDPVRLGMQIANVKQRQILPRVGKIWVSTPQNRTIGVNLRKNLIMAS